MDKFKIIELKSESSKNINTDLLFEIATARAEKREIIRLNFADVDRMESVVVSALKKMKANSMIQFFATAESFNQSSTEAIFILNKYPDIYESEEEKNLQYIYVKL